MASDPQGAGGPPPADQQPRTKLERSDPNQTNEGALSEQNVGPTDGSPTEQPSGGGYGNNAEEDEGAA